jgi:hypothetical protein
VWELEWGLELEWSLELEWGLESAWNLVSGSEWDLVLDLGWLWDRDPLAMPQRSEFRNCRTRRRSSKR